MEITFQQTMNFLAILGGIIGTLTGCISIWREIKRSSITIELDTTNILYTLDESKHQFKVVTIHNLGERPVKIVSVYLCGKNGKKGNETIIHNSYPDELPIILDSQGSANFFFTNLDKIDFEKDSHLLKYAGCCINYRIHRISKVEYIPEVEVYYSLYKEFEAFRIKHTSSESL